MWCECSAKILSEKIVRNMYKHADKQRNILKSFVHKLLKSAFCSGSIYIRSKFRSLVATIVATRDRTTHSSGTRGRVIYKGNDNIFPFPILASIC